MKHTQPHHLYADIEDCAPDGEKQLYLASVHPASPEAIALVAAAEEGSPDGRSEFLWLRLANGDLMLGVFPRGDTYLDVERDAQFPR